MTGRTPERVDGYAPLGDYLGLGDGRSFALVALDGSIDWWGVPELDAPPAFGALLDPESGGSITLAPTEPFTAEAHYVEHSNVVERVLRTAGGSVRITDSLNTGIAGRLPWVELGRRIEGISGEVTLAWRVRPGTALGTLSPWTESYGSTALLHVGTLTLAIRGSDVGAAEVGRREVSGSFTTSPGSRAVLGVSASADEPLYLPTPDAVDRRIDHTVAGWRSWSDSLVWDGPFEDAVRRSALRLKLLVYAPTGAIAAAGTTSLPERIGGGKNWDYRYTWIRDTAYSLDAFVRCGVTEEVHAAVAWLLGTVAAQRPGLHPFYSLRGALPSGSTARDVPGYRASGPVVDGNDAVGQLQLGPYGDLFQTVHLSVQGGHVLDESSRRLLTDLANRCCDDWQRPDAGMWELPQVRQYTASKMSCWQALDRAARLSDLGLLPDGPGRWRREADSIADWVNEHCWSDRRQAYTMHPDTDDLDAGVLLGARFGFETGPRMVSTIDAVFAELSRGPLLYRYTGMEQEEGAFLACSFWAVEALALTGDRDRAWAQMEATLEIVGTERPLTEMVDPNSGELLGNLPQALSHLALINAASALGETASG